LPVFIVGFPKENEADLFVQLLLQLQVYVGAFFLNVTLCCLVERYQNCGGTYYLHVSMFRTALFCPQEGDSTFPENVDTFLPVYTTSYAIGQYYAYLPP
jgi:hypothetical protein